MKSISIGIIGAGTVGAGVIDLLEGQRERLVRRSNVRFEIKTVCDLLWREKGELLRGIPGTDDAATLLQDPEIDIIVELIGGQEPARTLILEAIDRGKSVVTANKALLARSGREIFRRAAEKNVEVGFEAAVAGALPVIKTLRRGLIVNDIRALYGILNGTCNFIITRMQEEGMDYDRALQLAQERGFAEADPSFDVNGNDAAQKLAILAGLAFDADIDEGRVPVEGIASIRQVDLALAASMGYVIRLLAVARRTADGSLLLRVHPAMISRNHNLASVVNEKNAIFFDTAYSGPCMIMGLGAGSHPTAAAVISDLVAVARNRQGEPEIWSVQSDDPVRFTRNYRYRYYLRFQTVDRPGVLAQIAGILAGEEISINSMLQQEGPEPVNVVLTTHEAPENRMLGALEKIDRLAVVLEPTVHLRIEDQI